MTTPTIFYGSRDPEYECDLGRLRTTGKSRDINIVTAAERKIIASEGFPANSVSVYQALLGIDQATWQMVVDIIAIAEPKYSLKESLQQLQRQRIFMGNCIDVIYTSYIKFDCPHINFHYFKIHGEAAPAVVKRDLIAECLQTQMSQATKYAKQQMGG